MNRKIHITIRTGILFCILPFVFSCAPNFQRVYKDEMGRGFIYETTANDDTYKSQFDGLIELTKISPSIEKIEEIKKVGWKAFSQEFIEKGSYYKNGNGRLKIYYNFSVGKPDGDGFELEKVATMLIISIDPNNNNPIPENSIYFSYMEGMCCFHLYKIEKIETRKISTVFHFKDEKNRPLWIDVKNNSNVPVENSLIEMRKYWKKLEDKK